MYNVKVLDNLREMFNLPEGVKSINFNTGFIRVKDFKSLLDIAEQMQIDSVKTKSYNKIIENYEISDKLEIGTVSRIRDNGKCIHVVIIGIHKNIYTAAKLNLGLTYNDNDIKLEKGKDVIYLNPTYKKYTVIEVDKLYHNLILNDFLDSHGRVVGKVINVELLNKLIEKNTLENSDCPASLEDFILQLNLSNGMLEKAIILAREMKTYNIRKLTAEIKKVYNITESQKEIKAKIDEEYYNKVITKYVKKLDRSAFLRMIIKNF